MILTGMLLFCTVFSIAGCGEETGNSSTPYEEPANQISYEHGKIVGRIDWEERISAIIRSKEELINIFNGIEVVWTDEKIWEIYDESFFETKALVLDVMWEYVDGRKELSYVCVEDDTLILHRNTYFTESTVSCVSYLLPYLIEVDKTDVEHVETVVVFVNGQQRTW